MTPAVRTLLEDLKRQLRPAVLRAAVLIWTAVVLGAGLLARLGTSPARFTAAFAVVVATAWLIVRPWFNRRSERSERRVLARVLAHQPELLSKLQRALQLQSAPESGSVELASLHYRRAIERLPKDVVTSRIRSLRGRWNLFAALSILACLGVMARGAHSVVEGYDVMFASHGVAPWPMPWLEYPNIVAKAPPYLGNGQTELMWESAAGLPEGATVSVRGRPLWDGVELVLWNGSEEVPFVDDGEGALVAHWQLVADAELRVAARFGDVLVIEPVSVQVHALADQLPRVLLAEAPRELAIKDLEQLELQWRAMDDHQVSQVDLVLRAGGKEERRTLDRPSLGLRQASGGHLLYPDDPFISQAFLPVVVRVEARDNNAERKRELWGKSESFVLKPANVGEAQVARLLALESLRDEMTDLLAAQLKASELRGPASATRAVRGKLGALRERARSVLGASHAGLSVARGMRAFVQGQLDTAWRDAQRPGATAQKLTQVLESTLLAVDAGLGSLSHRDAQDVAKSLGDVADEMAFAARQAQEGEEALEPAKERLDLAISVLRDGAALLRKLGNLGMDLGLVAVADLDRVQRSRNMDDYLHAELAALHLAGRLHRPNPSFGAKGGGGAVESGNGQQGGEGESSGKASDADEAFDRLARDLAELAQEHADAVDRTSNALDSAESEIRSDGLAEEAKSRAQALRRAVAGLPEPGEAPSTSRSSAALSREHAGAMAHDFDNLDFEEAVESGRRAKSAAEEAMRRGDLDDWTGPQVERALSELRAQLQWATEQRDAWQKQREQAAKGALSEVSKSEMELGERARRLSSEASGQAQLPEQTRQKLSSAEELMRQAAQHLNSGRGQVGLDLQRQAQRLLEESQPGQTSEAPPRQSGKNEGGRSSGFGGTVPAEERKRQAEDFRRRVLEGLAKSEGGKLAPAVKRYAEGLLR